MQSNHPAPEAERSVLIVDDNAAIRDTLARLLQLYGLRTVTAPDGQVALQCLRNNPSIGLIILDLRMPSMDGWEFRIRQVEDPKLASIPVVVCSGTADVTMQPVFDGILSFHSKPVDPDRLIALARGCCSP